MSDLLHFEVVLTNADGKPEHCVVFFGGPDLITAAQVAEALQTHLQTYVLPDHVVFLQPAVYLEAIKTACTTKNSELAIALGRRVLRFAPSYGFAFFDTYGEIKQYLAAGEDRTSDAPLIVGRRKEVVSAGIQRIVKITNVLPKAPSGYLYYKPSSRSSNYFIRAENLLSETSHAHFLAFASLFLFANADEDGFGRADTLYLDTMAFLPVALSMGMYRHLFESHMSLRIESFHSHDGLKGGSLPNAATALCLISASSSCGLAQEWQRVNSARKGRVLTFLSFSKSSDYCNVLHQLEKPKDYQAVGENDTLQARKLIRVHGERFVAEHSATKILNISTHHLPPYLQTHFDGFVGGGFFSCYRGSGQPGKHRTVHVNKGMLVASNEFNQWFSTCLQENLPASTTHIIHDDDDASCELATRALDYLEGLGITNCRQVSMGSFDDSETFNGSAVVIAAAAERGAKLLSISRLLRRAQLQGTRLYIIGALFGRSYAQIAELSSNLTQPAKDSQRYSIRTFMEIPAASQSCTDHWGAELRFLSELSAMSDDGLPPLLDARIRVLNGTSTSGLDGHPFWPSSATNEPMRLSPGFAFVTGAKDVTQASAADVFLTILWVLQYARESLKIDDEKRLASAELQQVLLSPEVFARYDDGIIQSAFLRAALAMELDYSAHEAHSLSMSDIICRVVTAYGREKGEAAVEFLIALAIGKIRLTPEVFENLKGTLVTEMTERLPWIGDIFEQHESSL